MLISVVFPAPLGPSKAKISPRRISRLTRLSAWKPEAYVLERFDMEMMCGMGVTITECGGSRICEAESLDNTDGRIAPQARGAGLTAWRGMQEIESREIEQWTEETGMSSGGWS